jgi:hypothetical protein
MMSCVIRNRSYLPLSMIIRSRRSSLSETRKGRAAQTGTDHSGSELDVVDARKTPLAKLGATLDDAHRVCLCITVSDKRRAAPGL